MSAPDTPNPSEIVARLADIGRRDILDASSNGMGINTKQYTDCSQLMHDRRFLLGLIEQLQRDLAAANVRIAELSSCILEVRSDQT